MQLMVQVPSDRVSRSFLVEAKDVDVLARLERSMDTLTIRLTSYEWNARTSIVSFKLYGCLYPNGLTCIRKFI